MHYSSSILKRPNVFISYHHDEDQHYFDAFRSAFHDYYEIVRDRSLDRAVDSDSIDYIIRRIRENHIAGTSCTVLLCGAQTHGRKYVNWELKATLDKQHGLVGVRLPTARYGQDGILVPDRFYDDWHSGYAPWVTWEQITASPESCASIIADANGRNKSLIDNTRSRRLRNATLVC